MASDDLEFRLDNEEVRKKLEEMDSQPHTYGEPGPQDIQAQTTHIEIKKSRGEKFVALLKNWRFWLSFIFVLLIVLTALWVWQPSRIWTLNTLGFAYDAAYSGYRGTNRRNR